MDKKMKKVNLTNFNEHSNGQKNFFFFKSFLDVVYMTSCLSCFKQPKNISPVPLWMRLLW